jgi:hypothetical protein
MSKHKETLFLENVGQTWGEVRKETESAEDCAAILSNVPKMTFMTIDRTRGRR